MILIWSHWTYLEICPDEHESLERAARREWSFGPRRRGAGGVEFKMRRKDEVLVLTPFNQTGPDEPFHCALYQKLLDSEILRALLYLSRQILSLAYPVFQEFHGGCIINEILGFIHFQDLCV